MKVFMKFAVAAVAVGLCVTANAQNRADRQNLENPESFSMIVLGDPQGYEKYDINQPLFELCTAWIADNVDHLNIKGVLCTGDLVEQNENIVMNRDMLNQTSREMWESVSCAFDRLDNRVPYFISGGNHDYGYQRAENGMTHLPDYFPFERNNKWRDIIVSSYPNRQGVLDIENAAFAYDLPHWGKILLITTEFAPREEVLAWALNLCKSDKYRDYKVILMTHSLLQERNAAYVNNTEYDITPQTGGQEMWDKLIAPAGNILFVLCGHMGTVGDYEDSIAYRVDKNEAGRKVHQMMFNVQTLGGGWEGNGGDGWLRILEFLPDGKTVKVKTYSPLFGISPLTKHLAHRTAPYDQFDMVLE